MNPYEPQPGLSAGKAPSWLKGRGRRAWGWLAPRLTDRRVLTTDDEQALALICDVFAEYLECSEIIRREGRTYATTTVGGGELIRARPEVAMAGDAWRRAMSGLGQFGLTPASRSKVSAAPQDEAADPFAQLFEGA